jgi:hypothetical protein
MHIRFDNRIERMRGPAAIPIIAAVAGSVASAGANKAFNSGNGPTGSITGMPGYAGATGAAGGLSNAGRNLYNLGAQNLGQASSYYSTMLGRGGRGEIERAVAPVTNNISSTYAGAARGISGRTGTEALQKAELARGAAGDINKTVSGAPMEAAAGLAGIGGQATGQGLGGMQGAGGIYSSLLSGSQNQNQFLTGLRANQSAGLGSGIGSLLSQFITAKYGGKPTVPGGVTPAAGTPPPLPTLPTGTPYPNYVPTS